MNEEQSLDDILAEAEALMKQLGLDTDVLDEIPTEEDLQKEAEEETTFFTEHMEGEDPFADIPIEVRNLSELSEVEYMQIEDRYGQQNLGRLAQHGRMVQEIRTLSLHERAIFSGQSFVSPNFNLQFLYKINSDMDRRDVIANINEFFAETPLLRVNFLSLGVDAKMYKIVFAKRQPSVNFSSMKFLKAEALNKTIEKIMSDERQRPFDLQNDVLVRFNLIRVGDENYALIVTMSRILADAWREDDFFRRVFKSKNLQRATMIEEEQPFSVHTANYYLKLLNNLPPTPKIPRFSPDYGRYVPRTHQTFLHPEFFKILKERSLDKRDVMIAIIATAWGLLLKQVNYSRDTYFALLLSEHNLVRNPQATASKIYPLPIRIIINNNMKIDDIVGKLLRQMLTSKSLACSNMKYMLKQLGDPSELFPSVLHFHGFFQTAESFDDAAVEKGFKLLDVEAFDAGRQELNIYFDIKKEGLSMTFRYNPFSFEHRTIKPLAKYFEIALGCLLLSFGQDVSLFEEIYSENVRDWDRSFASVIV